MQLGLDIAPDVGVNRRSRSVAQPGSASGLGPEGREFESLHSDHFSLKIQVITEQPHAGVSFIFLHP